MKQCVPLGLLLSLAVLPVQLAAQERLAGDWQGHWYRAGDSLGVTLHLTRDSATGTYRAVFDSDRLRVLGIPFTEVKVEGCCTVTMRLVGDRTTAIFTGTLRANTLAGGFREGEREGRFAYARAGRRSAPLVEREVSFRNGEVTLAGSLVLPSTGAPHPAVVFVHGSGGEGRWASRFLATAFAKQGVAALIFDKRGVGQSSGDWRTATLDDLAGDVAAAVEYLRQEKPIDPARIGVHGHSQGGTLAPMIAVRSRAAFVIASAAAGTPTDSTEIFSILNSVLPSARTASDSADARRYVGELVGTAYQGLPRERLDPLVSQFQGQPWFVAPPSPQSSYWSFSKLFGAYQPLEWWRQVKVPVLLLYGERDERVPPSESAARIAGALLRNAPAADLTVRILPGADHTFRLPPGPSGWPVTAPEYLPTLLSWIRAR